MMRPSSSRSGTEFFHVVTDRKGRHLFRWTENPNKAISVDSALLCRERMGQQGYAYSLVKRLGGVTSTEVSINASPVRLQHALAAIANTPSQFALGSVSGCQKLTFRNALPKAEFRLLEALGRRQPRTGEDRTYHIDEGLEGVLCTRLLALGYQRIS